MTPVEINVNDKERHRQIKARFGGFVEEYEKLYFTHNRLQIEDDALRRDIRVSIREKFLNQYTTFFDTYSNVPFSKKRMNEYLKYKPAKIESMINELFSCSTSTQRIICVGMLPDFSPQEMAYWYSFRMISLKLY